MADLERLLRRFYHSVILRDVLGYALPGLISLVTIAAAFSGPLGRMVTVPAGGAAPGAPGWIGGLSVLAFGYLWGWVLRSIHLGMLGLLDVALHRLRRKGLSGETAASDVAALIAEAGAVTRAGLESDTTLLPSLPAELLKRRAEEMTFSDRQSALMAISGNLATALVLGIPMALIGGVQQVFKVSGLGGRLGMLAFVVFLVVSMVVIAAALYAEFGRLRRARALRAALYADLLQKAR